MNLLKLITPTNIVAEKEKFFSSHDYNPRFEYDWGDTQPCEKPRTDKEFLINAILAQDYSNIVKYAEEFFQTNLENAYAEASEVAENVTPHVIPFDKEKLSLFLKRANELLGLDYGLEVVDDAGFNFRPNYSRQTIQMSKHARLDFFSAEGEIQHELTHVIRYENHKYNQLPNIANYLPTDEGLATLMQDSVKKENYSGYQHAVEYLASKIGVEGSLRDIFDFFVEKGFAPELAWQRAIRHKFGFMDTSKPGDIIKPAMYFAHGQRIAKLSKEDVLNLFQGRITIDDVEKVRNMEGKIKKAQIMKFFDYFLD